MEANVKLNIMSGKTNRCALQSDVWKGQEQNMGRFILSRRGKKWQLGHDAEKTTYSLRFDPSGAEQYQVSIQIVAVNKQ